MINLFKAFNKLHDMRGNCVITPYNFAVNDRPYDPTKKGQYLSYASITALNTAANLAVPPYIATLGA
jgi:hypothetical protein